MNQPAQEKSSTSAILIAEDDLDQKNLLVDFAVSQIKHLLDDETLTDEQKLKLKNINVLSVSNIAALQQAAVKHKKVLLAILDCNMPDTKGGPSHDQFIKTKHKITGQHRSVDIITEHLPTTPITIVSSLNRFQKIISQFYKNKFDIDINFINKKDPSTIQRNIRYYLQQHLK